MAACVRSSCIYIYSAAFNFVYIRAYIVFDPTRPGVEFFYEMSMIATVTILCGSWSALPVQFKKAKERRLVKGLGLNSVYSGWRAVETHRPQDKYVAPSQCQRVSGTVCH